MKRKTARYSMFVKVLLLTGVVTAAGHFFVVDNNSSFAIFVGVLGLLLIASLVVLHLYTRDWLSAYEHKENLIESRRLLRQHQEALKKIAANKALFGGDFVRASRIISELAATTLRVDRAILWLIEDKTSMLRSYYSYDRRQDEIPRDDSQLIDISNQDLTDVNEYRVLLVDGGDAALPDMPFLRALCCNYGSAVIAPIRRDADIVGFLSLLDGKSERVWNIDEQSFAASIADFLSMARDAELRKRIQSELEKRSVALESTADGMAILDQKENFIFVNHSLLKMFGYSGPDVLISKSWRVLYSTAEVQRIERLTRPLLRATGKARLEAVGCRCNGSIFSHELSLTALDGGGFVCTVTDSTERRMVEENLRRSQRFLDQVVNANPTLIFVKDAQSRFTLVNQAVADIYGTTVSDLIGKRDSDFNSQTEETDHFVKHDKIVIEEGRDIVIPEEVITDAKGNLHYLHTIKRPLRLGPNEPTQVLGVATDVTDRKKLEEQLVQAQKMEAIGQLAGGIAHDFNNYLTGIIGYTGLLKLSTPSKGDVEHAAEMIESIARKASQLTEKLLGFARKGKNQNTPVDLHSTIKETLALLSRTIEKNIALSHDLLALRSYVMGDPMQIQQVVLNLAINARDAIAQLADTERSAGKISISTRDMTVGYDNVARFGNLRPGQYICIDIQDSGCGIQQELMEKIFEPFFTTKDPGKGTGMGLAMVYGIVRNHGGGVLVESTINEGSTFSVLLPSVERPRILPIEITNVGTVKGKGHILIVDDHQVILDVTARMLSSLGYDVVTARDGEEALRYYRDNKDEIDLIILDMVMPKMGARECFREIKKINPDVRAILSTGYGNNNAVQEILNEGMLGFVQKPYQLSKLSEVVASVLEAPVKAPESEEDVALSA